MHQLLGRSRAVTRVATRLRNQFGAIVASHVATTSCHGAVNGEHLFARTIAPGSTYFIDVGANMCEWTDAFLAANRRKARGLLFEPNHGTFVQLQRKFAGHPEITLVEAAVTDYEGEAEFFEEPDCGRTSSLTGVNARPDAVQRKVKLTTLDVEVEARGWPKVDMVKIDAEGHDFYVLRGARHLLARGRIHVAQFEYAMEWAATGATLAGAFNFLAAYGYKTYTVRPDGLYHFDPRRYGETFAHSNFVAVAPGQENRVAPLIKGNW